MRALAPAEATGRSALAAAVRLVARPGSVARLSAGPGAAAAAAALTEPTPGPHRITADIIRLQNNNFNKLKIL